LSRRARLRDIGFALIVPACSRYGAVAGIKGAFQNFRGLSDLKGRKFFYYGVRTALTSRNSGMGRGQLGAWRPGLNSAIWNLNLGILHDEASSQNPEI
jgi:hypothetical protein